MNGGAQFERIANLLVANTAIGQGRDLSQMHFRFSVRQADNETPNTLVVRIYNLSDSTENEIRSLYTQVTLQAGYVGTGPEVLFVGTIKSFRTGKESPVDKFLEICAADGDLGYNFGLVNLTLGSGASQTDVLKASAAAMEQAQGQQEANAAAGGSIDPTALTLAATGGIMPRGKVMFGLARLHLRNSAATVGARWSIQDNGTITYVPVAGYLPREAVVLTPLTGLIGIPESTNDGITVRCLLNPKVRIGTPLQIASADITKTTAPADQLKQFGGGINFPSYTSIEFPATVSDDAIGTYRVLVVEHQGDTRGVEWYSDIVCLMIDTTAPIDSSVKKAG